jgi:hypothetical protein
MDADRFDEIAKALGLSAARRGMVAGLLGGGVASLLANLEAGARRRTRRNDGLSAEKKRKKKCKKCGACQKCKKGKCKPKPNGTPCSGGSCQSGACRVGDEVPPCTEESCPLPSGCSEQALEDCSTLLQEALLADAEHCRPDCEAGDSPACQACLEPVLTVLLPEIEGCALESCSSTRTAATRLRATAQGGPASARVGWVRHCTETPCCYQDLHECAEDLAEELLQCTVFAGLSCFAPIPGLCGGAFLYCLAKFTYDEVKCNERHGCPGFGECKPDNTCCPRFEHACAESNSCCLANSHCCEGGGCCKNGDTCCFRQSSQTLFCCPPGAQCMQTGIPCCSNC